MSILQNKTSHIKNIIFLIGFMGSGKSYWGKLWANYLNIPFFDLDDVIEQQQKKTITEIFETNGENYFREIETKTLNSFLNKSICIIACGGGTPCFNNNMQWMNDNGKTVFLSASVDEIFKRIITEQDKRPLIKDKSINELKLFIKNKLAEREAFYHQAKIILPVATLNVNSIDSIINQF